MMWTIIIISLSLLLAAWLIWTAVRRSNRAHLAWRVVACLAAVTALACIAFDFKYNTTVKDYKEGGVILLTPGAEQDSVAAFREQHTEYPVYTFDENIAKVKKNEVQYLSGPSELNAASSQQIHIFGYGLEPYQLTALDKHPIIFHAASSSLAFESISWQAQINSGEPLIVQGLFNNNSNDDVIIMLQGFSTNLDSVKLKAGSIHRFELTTIPRQVGRAVYTLSVLKNGTPLQDQKIPFTVINPPPLRILMLSSAPDFENRFLKNWLFSRGYALALRTTISRDKYHTELLNMEGPVPGKLNSNMLNNFDLVIGDATALVALNGTERNLIKSAVEQQGLGLIVKADSIAAANNFFTSGVRFRESSVNHRQQVQLYATDSSMTLPILETDRPKHITSSSARRPLFADREGNLYAVAGLAGMGRLIYITLTNTYSWVLQGDTMAYRHLWSSLINEAAKQKIVTDAFTVSPAIAYAGEAVEIVAETADTIPSRIDVNQNLKPVMQNALMPFQWKAMFWPQKKGWQQLRARDNMNKYWYVYSNDEWQQIRARQRIDVNRAFAAGNRANTVSADGVLIQQSRTVRKVYFFIIFIISCAYLWIEEKFYRTQAKLTKNP
ncbi:MAG: hypothetical protein EOO04_05670 [Chitinophagaceae bacterium]|nr:MAG: hypothetical protein EOO04_05670 [Chitinophagaceae bacterium]